MNLIFLLLAIIAGAMFPVQGAVNGVLRNEVGNPFLSGTISNFVGLSIMFLLAIITKNKMPLTLPHTTNQNWFMWIGGIISALIVSANIVIPPYIGFSTFLSIYMVSQLVISIFIDYFGLFGANQQAVSFNTVIGMLFLAIGIYFIVFKA